MDPDQLRQILREELKPVIQTQKEQGKVLAEHGKMLAEHGKILGEHGKIFGEHGEKLDSLTIEIAHIHKLADATYDLVQATYENNKREVDEIKDYLHIPKQPYFGENEN